MQPFHAFPIIFGKGLFYQFYIQVFKNIYLQPQYEVIHLNWIKPEKNESLRTYALRMAEKIDRSEKFGLVGLSLGGMVATEIAKAFPPEKVVLISSIPLSSHMPAYFRWAGFLRLHRIVPVSLIKQMARVKRVFTAETSEDKKMFLKTRSSAPSPLIK